MARVRVLEPQARSPGRVETETALTLAQRMPRLILESRRVAASLSHGIHGRRRAGIGETFWQFRPFVVARPPSASTGAAPDVTTAFMFASANGRRRKASGSGSIVPPRWALRRTSPRRRKSSARWCSALPSATPLWKAASGSACLA